MRRRIAPLVVFTFIFILITAGMPYNVFAYQNTSYNRDLRVGLKSMQAVNMDIILNGNYKVNGILFTAGTSFNIRSANNKLVINGVEFNEAEFHPEQKSNTLSINNGTKKNKYQGSFIFKVIESRVMPTNVINIEDYLKGVVGYEMSDYFPVEALKAQTVAARNYALLRVGSLSSLGYDFDDTESYQVYGGYNENYKRVISAVDQTRGMVLLHNDRLVETLYSASHGGHTEASVNVWGNFVPYLKSKPDPFENESWPLGNRTFSNLQIESALRIRGYLTLFERFVKIDLSSITRYPSGRVSNVNVVYTDPLGIERVKSFTRDLARTFLSLPSSMYYVTYDEANGIYTFSGKGYGHGLGMSQIGAKNRAAAGQAYEDILKFYYEDSYLQCLTTGASIESFTSSVSSLQTGQSVTFNAKASQGFGQIYLYKYTISKDNAIVHTSNYSTNTSFSYVPSTAGNYQAIVYLKNASSLREYDDTRSLNFSVIDAPKITSLTASGTLYEKMPISVKAEATDIGTSSLPYRYELSKNGSIIEARDFRASTDYSFTPDTVGTYKVKVYVKGTTSRSNPDFAREIVVNILEEPLKVSRLAPKRGMNDGDAVKVQLALKSLGYITDTVNEASGARINTQLVKFQKANKIPVTGIIDLATVRKLNNSLIKASGIKALTSQNKPVSN